MLRTLGLKIDQGIKIISGILLLICLASSTVDIVNRLFIGRSLPWSHDVSVWACIIFTFLFVGIITLEGTHISSDLITKYLKGYPKTIITSINLFTTLIFCAISCYGGIQYSFFLLRRHVTTDLGIWTVPQWPLYLSSIGLGMLIATAYNVIALARALKSPKGDDLV